MRCLFKLYASVVPEYLRIDVTMDYKEQDQEQTGKTHLKLLTDRGAEIIFPVHITVDNLK
jgi:hypothetical protein